MKLQISENIRRLRQEKGMTQIQLAELLNLSTAAVSKWETGLAYPDITMLIPLAQVFDVSVDELMGYNAVRIEAEIESVISEYFQFGRDEKWQEASQLIAKARKDYPNDYRIMNFYMQDIIGGSADNNPQLLITHQEELTGICDCILEGCADDSIRLEAMNIKAKILHAKGDTDGALEILKLFPSWYQSSNQKTEQLFAKDTPEFCYQLRKNMYDLAGFTANKIIKSIWYTEGVPQEERVRKCEEIIDAFSEMYQRTGETVFLVSGEFALAELCSKVTHLGGSSEDIERVRARRLSVIKQAVSVAKSDGVLREILSARHIMESCLAGNKPEEDGQDDGNPEEVKP